jgi:hypothetical protein
MNIRERLEKDEERLHPAPPEASTAKKAGKKINHRYGRNSSGTGIAFFIPNPSAG